MRVTAHLHLPDQILTGGARLELTVGGWGSAGRVLSGHDVTQVVKVRLRYFVVEISPNTR